MNDDTRPFERIIIEHPGPDEYPQAARPGGGWARGATVPAGPIVVAVASWLQSVSVGSLSADC